MRIPLKIAALAIIFCALGGGAVATFASCSNVGSYIFLADPFDDTRGCLNNPVAIDVISGDDPGINCVGRCFVATVADDSGIFEVYGSTMCGPPPFGFDSDAQTDPRCAIVLAAVNRSDICEDDGGQTAPLDSGSDAITDAMDAADAAISDVAIDAE